MTLPKVGKPTAVTIDDPSIIRISWTLLAENIGIAKYKVLCFKTPNTSVPDGVTDIIDNITVETNDGTQNSVVATLTIGVSYTFTVTAWDAQNTSSDPSDPSDPIFAPTFPGLPADVTLAVSGRYVTVSWTPPVNNGYSKIILYRITNAVTGDIQDVEYVEGMNYSVSLRSILSPVTQVFIIAFNSVGGQFVNRKVSNIIDSTNIIDIPRKVGKPDLEFAGNSRIDIYWDDSANNNNNITKYKVLCFKTPNTSVPDGITDIIDNLTLETNDRNTLQARATLTPGVSYTFTVTAWDAQDNSSDPSDPSDPIILATLPGPPTGVTLSVSGNDIIISWTPPLFTGYKEIIEYLLWAADGTGIGYLRGSELNSPQITYLLPGVTQVYMKTSNGVEISVASALSNILGGPGTGSTVPDFPINVVAVAGGSRATITWEVPVSDGGSAITEYIIVSTPDNKSQTVPGDTYTCTMTGLKPGTSYTFQVFSKNAIGISGTSPAIVAL